MFEIVGRLRCPICSEPVQLGEKVFLDIINTVIHQKCYYKSPQRKLPIKDEGSFQKMLLKYPFFSMKRTRMIVCENPLSLEKGFTKRFRFL